MAVDDSPTPTVGMLRAHRWANWVPAVLTAAITGALGWKAALIFAAVAVTIRLEANRVLATIWPECYHAVRKAVEDDRLLRD